MEGDSRLSKLYKKALLDAYAMKLIEEMAELNCTIKGNKAEIEKAADRINSIAKTLVELGAECKEDNYDDD